MDAIADAGLTARAMALGSPDIGKAALKGQGFFYVTEEQVAPHLAYGHLVCVPTGASHSPVITSIIRAVVS